MLIRGSPQHVCVLWLLFVLCPGGGSAAHVSPPKPPFEGWQLGSVAVLSGNGDVGSEPTLSREGQRRMEALGAILWRQYGSLLPPDLADLDERAHTTSAQPSVRESALAVLSGLYNTRVSRDENYMSTRPEAHMTCRTLREAVAHIKTSLRWKLLERDTLGLRRLAAEYVGLRESSLDDVWVIHERLASLPPSDTHGAVIRQRIDKLLTDLAHEESRAALVVPAAGLLLTEMNSFLRDVNTNFTGADMRYRHWFGSHSDVTMFAAMLGLNITYIQTAGVSIIAEVWRQPANGTVVIEWKLMEVLSSKLFGFEPSVARMFMQDFRSIAELAPYLRASVAWEITIEEWCVMCSAPEPCQAANRIADHEHSSPGLTHSFIYLAGVAVFAALLALVVGASRKSGLCRGDKKNLETKEPAADPAASAVQPPPPDRPTGADRSDLLFFQQLPGFAPDEAAPRSLSGSIRPPSSAGSRRMPQGISGRGGLTDLLPRPPSGPGGRPGPPETVSRPPSGLARPLSGAGRAVLLDAAPRPSSGLGVRPVSGAGRVIPPSPVRPSLDMGDIFPDMPIRGM